jgi:23S rRNA pseudouridine1911/1915/1917 synthase
MSTPLNFTIKESEHGFRLDKYLASLAEIHSRSRAALLIKQGLVFVNESKTKASYILQTKDKITILLPTEKKYSTLEPYSFNLDIIYEDNDIIVLNKPSGLVCHPSPGHPNKTLVNALLNHTDDLSMGFNEHRPGIVHRLDKDTSGLMLVAKNDKSQNELYKQFIDKSITRTYLALCYGKMTPDNGTITSYLKRHPTDRKKFASVNRSETIAIGKKAITHYQTLNTSTSGISLLKCNLETGRTHQIRIHLSESHCAIIGDPIYGSKNRVKSLKSTVLRGMINELDRIGLHAAQIKFNHPITNSALEFSIGWPEDLLPLISFLGFENENV